MSRAVSCREYESVTSGWVGYVEGAGGTTGKRSGYYRYELNTSDRSGYDRYVELVRGWARETDGPTLHR